MADLAEPAYETSQGEPGDPVCQQKVLTGSYGVNVFGYDFYRQCIREGLAQTEGLGTVLGAYHPCVAGNAARLQQVSGLDEVSFHMSGTEAVMQAVRLARYHTRRRNLVRFCGAYHGWWEDVQPGIGNPLPPRQTYTLKDMDEKSLRVLRDRKDIGTIREGSRGGGFFVRYLRSMSL